MRNISHASQRHLSVHMLAAHFVLTFLLLAVSPNFHPLSNLVTVKKSMIAVLKFEPNDHPFHPHHVSQCKCVTARLVMERKLEPNGRKAGIWCPQLPYPSAAEVVKRA